MASSIIADALAPRIANSSVAMVLTKYDKFPVSSMFLLAALEPVYRVALAVLRVGQELLLQKVAPMQPSETPAFPLQSWRDSDCQIWQLLHDRIVLRYKC